MRETLDLYRRLVSVQFRSQLQYRTAFALDLLGALVNSIVWFGGLALVFQHDRALLDGPLEGEWVRNRERRSSLGLNFRPSSQWVLKLGYEWNATTNRPLVRGDKDGWVGSVGFVF